MQRCCQPPANAYHESNKGMKTRILRLVAPLGLLVLASVLQVSPVGHAQTVETYHDRADQALQSFLVNFWDGGHQYLRNRFPDNGSLTGYWTYAHGWDAVIDHVERTRGQIYAG